MKTQSSSAFIAISAIAAGIAAIASWACVRLDLQIWVMFIGWVAYYTRGANPRDGAWNFACVLGGMAIGIGSVFFIEGIAPTTGTFTMPVAVFVVAGGVVSLRSLAPMDNLLCYFLGLIAFYASHRDTSPTTLLVLGSAAAMGSFGAWLAQSLTKRFFPD